MAAEGLGPRPPALREAVAAGEPLEPSLIELVAREWGVDLRDGYGQTETTGQIGNPPGRPATPGSMGLPLPGYTVVLLDPETGEEVPDGQQGEIGVTYVARADDMFKAFDHRISPRELENVLLRHPAVADAAVTPVPDPVGLWAPKAWVIAAAGHDAGPRTAEGILKRVQAELPPEKWVRVIQFVPSLPRTASGKVRRAELRARATDGTEYRLDVPDPHGG